MPLKIVKKKGSPYWYVRGTIGGVEIFQSTKRREKASADAYRIALEGKLTEENDRFVSGQKRFSIASAAYVKNGGEERFLEKINARIGDLFLDEISQEVCDTVSREMFPTQKASYVKRAFYDPVLAVLNYAAKLRWCAKPSIDRPAVIRPAPKWAEIEWFEAFWPHCSPQLKAITTFLPYTGCRVTEAVTLTWDRVNLKERWAYIPENKTRTPRTVYLPAIVVRELKVIKKDKGRVFTWNSKDGVNRAIRRAVVRTNKFRAKSGLEPIPYLSSHKIGSHTYGTWMRRYAKLDAVGLVNTQRWGDPESTYIYSHAQVHEDAKKADLLPVPKKKKA